MTSLLLAMLILDRCGLSCAEVAANKAFFRLLFTQVSALCLPAVVFARITIFSGFVVTNNIILKLTDVDRGEGAAAEGLAFSTRVSIDLIH